MQAARSFAASSSSKTPETPHIDPCESALQTSTIAWQTRPGEQSVVVAHSVRGGIPQTCGSSTEVDSILRLVESQLEVTLGPLRAERK